MTTVRKIRIGLIMSLISLILSLLALEGALRWLDPSGAYAYVSDLITLGSYALPDETRGYVLRPGEYSMSTWTVRVTDAGRAVPDTNPGGACVIAALGDSVVFGHGVNDADTWVNLLARRYPEVRFVNTAFDAYNVSNIRAALEEASADGYVYLVNSNDVGPPIQWDPTWETDRPPSALAIYLVLARANIWAGGGGSGGGSATSPEAEADIEAIMGRDDLLAFGFEGRALAMTLEENYGNAVIIPHFQTYNSPTDDHPDPAGHARIAASMEPYLDQWLPKVCG